MSSSTVQTMTEARLREVEALKQLSERYPNAVHVDQRLYEVEAFRPGDKPKRILFYRDLIFPCLVFGEQDGTVFLREEFHSGRKADILVLRLFNSHPELVLEAMK